MRRWYTEFDSPRRSGGTGRRTGLKIPRPSLVMRVRPPPPAPAPGLAERKPSRAAGIPLTYRCRTRITKSERGRPTKDAAQPTAFGQGPNTPRTIPSRSSAGCRPPSTFQPRVPPGSRAAESARSAFAPLLATVAPPLGMLGRLRFLRSEPGEISVGRPYANHPATLSPTKRVARSRDRILR